MNIHRTEAAANYLDCVRDLLWDAADKEKTTERRLSELELAESRLRWVMTEIEIGKNDLKALQEKGGA